MHHSIRKAGLVAGLFFVLTNSSLATTFGPISVVEQAANSQYYVHGRVLGSSWVEKAPYINRPYTYWRITVAEQLYGEPLGSEITVRQPGGELGDQGYHVAGAAEFTGGEEVFIALRDTDQNQGVKEVVGLASGKFRVEQTSGGEKIVVSGLGLPVTGNDGKSLGPDDFKALLKRIAKKEISDADRNVFVSRNPTHEVENSPSTPAPGNEQFSTQQKNSSPTDLKSEPKPVEESLPESEESSTGSSAVFWIIAAVLTLTLLGGIVLALRR